MATKNVGEHQPKSKAIRKPEQRLVEAPKNLKDVAQTLATVIKFLYSETLVKWLPSDLCKAILYGIILYGIIDKDKKTLASECGERSDCNLLKGPEILKDLYELKKLLRHTKLFANLSAAGFSKEDVLLRKRTARILKPAFTVLADKKSKCLLVFIRGTHSLKDMLTNAIGAPVSFSHTICSDGEVKRNNEVSGYAHCGMLAAARWIRERCTPILLDALGDYPDFKIKIVGHSLGGGTAALLTYMLREKTQFSSSTCVTFGPAASTSLELAEFGKPFITSIINGSDMVPTLSAFSIHVFISESRNKIKYKHLKSVVRRHTSKVVNQGTEVVKKLRQRIHLCLNRSQRKKFGALHNLAEASRSSKTSCESLSEGLIIEPMSDEAESNTSIEGSDNDDTDEEEEPIVYATQSVSDEELLNQPEELELGKQDPINIHVLENEAATATATSKTSCESLSEGLIIEPMSDEAESNSSIEGSDNDDTDDEEEPIIYATQSISDEELLNLPEELELGKQDPINIHVLEKEAATAKDITEESSGTFPPLTKSKQLDNIHALYPPGRIMHIVRVPSSDTDEKPFYLYETTTQLYGKLRLSRKMIFDHLTNKYRKRLNQLINQLEKEQKKWQME